MIAYDNSGKASSISGDISQSFTITGANPILIVILTHNTTINSVTYGGVALTKLTSQASLNYGGLDLWYLINPATGANTLAIDGNSDFVSATWASYTGVKQTGFPDSQSKQDPATPSSPLTGSTTTVADNCWLIGGFSTAFGGASDFSAGANTTLRQSNKYDSAGTYYTACITDSNGAKTPAGSHSLAIAFPGSPGDVTNIMVSIEPEPDIDPATVTTSTPAGSITSNSATGGGNVTDDGGGTVSERGIAWGTSTNPTISGDHEASGIGTGAFGPVNMTGLLTDTHYYYRAYATNEAGTAYGANVEFDTLDAVISGNVILSGSPVENAKITLIDSDTDLVVDTQLTDSNGDYIFSGLDIIKQYHCAAEYIDNYDMYNTKSLPFLTPFEQ